MPYNAINVYICLYRLVSVHEKSIQIKIVGYPLQRTQRKKLCHVITIDDLCRHHCCTKKNNLQFENWSIIGEDMDKSKVARFLWPTA